MAAEKLIEIYMLVRGFWDRLKKPIVGLSPMDGVTDATFRHMVCKYSNPDLVMTEFTNVEGLARGAVKMLPAFYYEEAERPVVAQIYGVEPQSYYKCVVMLCYMGFDGIDINMGCPANKVAKRGSGAGLIKTPDLAKELVLISKKAARDWAEGISMEDAGVHPEIIKAVKELHPEPGPRVELPVSVKTRIGFDKDVSEEWMEHLIETEPANISLHGRTLRQMYLGMADWDSIARAADVVRGTGISFLGNGDVQSMDDAYERIEKYNIDGVLIGRATFGNPWFFKGKEPNVQEKLMAVVEHSRYLADNYPEHPFYALRKHLGWYCKGFDNAKELRVKFMKVETPEEVEQIVEEFLVAHGGLV